MSQDTWSQGAKAFYAEEAKQKRDSKYHYKFASAYKRLVNILSLAETGRLLDVGCGCGELATAIEAKVALYCGMDISESSLKVANHYNRDTLFICADMIAQPFTTKFDYITALTSLEFCQDKSSALKEIEGLLKSSGKIYIEVRNADFILFKWLSPFMSVLIKLGLIIPYETNGFRDLGIDEWKRLLTDHGWEVLQCRRSIRPIYGDLITRIKYIIIKFIAFTMPMRCHYMAGFLCCLSNRHSSTL